MSIVRDAETSAKSITVDAGTEDAKTFYKVEGGVYSEYPDNFLLVVNQNVDDEQMMHLAGLTGYAFSVLSGEGLSLPERVSENSFTLSTDFTKCRSKDHDGFINSINDMIAEGSPIRKTDRSGPGTAGTRLVEGMPGFSVEFYADSVIEFRKDPIKKAKAVKTGPRTNSPFGNCWV